jgi:xylan 1,4-beta-xylosidase
MLQLMHQLGDTRLPVNFTSRGGGVCASTVGGFASRNSSHAIALLYNQAERGDPIAPCAVELTPLGVDLSGASSGEDAASVWRIDQTHANPKAKWESIGMPQWPSDAQNQQIFQASVLVPEALVIGEGGDAVKLSLPPQGIAVIVLPLSSS